MQCPYCQSPLLEDSPACPRCGLTLEKAGAFFGTAPRLIRGVSDSAGVLAAADVRKIKRAIVQFERRFPQTGFTVAFMELPADSPGATYAYWVFNRSNPAGELNQGCENRHLFLLVDTAGGGAWMTVGYGLEPFIGERHLQQCLERTRTPFAAGEYASGVIALLGEAESVFREVIGTLPRAFGLNQNESAPQAQSEEAEPETAAAW